MDFTIQASLPRNTSTYCVEDKKISEAIETVFPMMTEDAFMVWNTIYIPLSYKYDISYMIDDILMMLRKLREDTNGGTMQIAWPSDTFAAKWDLKWDNKTLIINTRWNCVSGHVEKLLNESNSMQIEIRDFITEWKSVLKVLIDNLLACGYCESNLSDINGLYDEFNAIDNYGAFYN